MAYWRLHYHLVWTCYEREPLIDAPREHVMRRTVYGKAKELGFIVHAIGGTADHLHVVASIPPKLSVAECVGQLKGGSAHAVNLEGPDGNSFRWQAGYGALSVGSQSLAVVVAYVLKQAEHHRAGSTIAVYERIAERDDGVVVVLETGGPG